MLAAVSILPAQQVEALLTKKWRLLDMWLTQSFRQLPESYWRLTAHLAPHDVSAGDDRHAAICLSSKSATVRPAVVNESWLPWPMDRHRKDFVHRAECNMLLVPRLILRQRRGMRATYSSPIHGQEANFTTVSCKGKLGTSDTRDRGRYWRFAADVHLHKMVLP